MLSTWRETCIPPVFGSLGRYPISARAYPPNPKESDKLPSLLEKTSADKQWTVC